MVQRSSPAPFLVKTYQLVDDPTTDEMISWNENGDGFVVWKTADFAKDLLPNSFKHSNFSSFVRQLNTYGFHKTLPDKWEFANDFFKRGQRELLIKIHRRKTVTSAKGKFYGDADGGSASPPSGSGYDIGSSSTSSPESKNPGSDHRPTAEKLENLSGENEKLKKEKNFLTSELAQVKKQCDDLVGEFDFVFRISESRVFTFRTKYFVDLMEFLKQCVKVSPDQISRIIGGDAVVGATVTVGHEIGGDVNDDDEDGDRFRLFGVLLKDGKKKRGCVERNETLGVEMKKMKLQGDFSNDVVPVFHGRVGYIR